MKLTKCANGHFYDADKYQACPHCSGAAGEAQGSDSKTDYAFSGGNGFGGNGFGGNAAGNDFDTTQSGANFNFNGGAAQAAGGGEGKTMGFMDWNNPAAGAQAGNGMNSRPTGYRAPAPSDDGKTIGFMKWSGQQEDDRTEMANQRQTVQPVVGWLVCVEGNAYGRCFNLYCGKNFIGRSSDMDICLSGDNTVSRVRHAIVIYEPKAKKFFAQPGESHELFYLNGSVVLTNSELEDRDMITIGKTSLVFVPFCDERFGWNQ